jgi:hypothetical protein
MAVAGDHIFPRIQTGENGGYLRGDVSRRRRGVRALRPVGADANGPSGSGFDQGRNSLKLSFVNAGHTWYPAWWGNTQNFQQCDGDYAGSDGYTYYIHLHQVNH